MGHQPRRKRSAQFLGVERGATTVVSLMHPRQDLTHHPLVPLLLQAGAAVWTQLTRSASNDLTLVHEQVILDAAAGLVFLRQRGFGSIVTLGHSGGGRLYAFYLEQAGLAPAERIAATPAAARPSWPRRDAPGRRRGLPGPAPRTRPAAARLHRSLGG
jgi:hypothetical protein